MTPALQNLLDRIRSLRISTKLAVLITLLLALISAFIYFYLPPRWERQALSAVAEKALTVSNITAFSVSPAIVFDDSATIHETLESMRLVPELLFAVIYDTTGRVIDQIGLLKAQSIHHTVPTVGNLFVQDSAIISATTPIMSEGKQIGRLSFGLSLQNVQEEVKATKQTIAIMSALIFLVGMLSVISISKAVTQPLEEMVNTVEYIAEGDLTHRAPVLSRDEIGHLATSFNVMVDRLQSAYTELETINKSLEQRVQERTQALQQEISERTRSAAALRESEERYRSFFEDDLTGDYIATKDGTLLDCNPAFARMFGFSSVRAALGSKLAKFFIEPSSYETFLELLQKEKKLEYREEVMFRRDGELVHVVQNVIGMFNERGELESFRGYLFDDTRRKQLEQQLIQAQKMESIGVLAGGIAHDFNNILGIILGFAHHARSAVKQSSEVSHMLNTIISASERGASLVRQLLTFARKADIQVERVQIESLLQDLVNMCSETFPRTIRFVTELPDGLPSISADPNQLHQAFLNLLLNARDAMPEGGTLRVKSQLLSGAQLRKTKPEAQDEQYLQISISDTGAGMTKATQERIFEPFYTTKERNKGTGLGLSVVYGIINTHRGFIDVQSEPGAGTTINVHLPARHLPQEDLTAVHEEQTHRIGGTETLLIVEDEEMLRDLLKTFLEAEGYTVLTAGDGEEGVKVFTDHKNAIALVLSDMGLPKLGGWEAFQKMKLVNPHVKAILASGYFDLELKAEMVKAGAKDFIQKPYIPKKILSTIRTILDEGLV